MFSQLQPSSIILNDGQLRVTDIAVNRYLRGDLNPIEISGPPGTGKSVVLNEIKMNIGVNPNRIAPMAFIGQAACVMRLKGFSNARTVHSWAYEPQMQYSYDKKSGEFIYDPQFGTRVTNLGFTPRKLENIDVIFLDEAYSLPLRHRHVLESNRIPIICAGDPNQLPPVGDKPAYLTDPKTILYLTEIMRQKQNSGILYLANRALHGLPIHKGFYGDAIVIYEDELDDLTMLNADVILCGTNSTRENINKHIRKIKGCNTDIPTFGERVICRKNNFQLEVDGIGLANGLLGTVTNQPNVGTFDGHSFKMDFSPDLCSGTFFDVNVDYEFFSAPMKEKDRLKKRNYNYGEYFDWGYAVTTHLAQGGQWRKVIYFEDWLPNDREKINFVATTRASEALIWVKKRPKMW